MESAHRPLSSKAFGEHADPRLIIAYGAYLAARHHLDAMLDHPGGCMLLSGPRGSGKTTTVVEHAAWVGRDIPVAVIDGTDLSPRQLVDSMLAQFRVKHRDLTDEKLLGVLGRFLAEMTGKDRVPLLCIDNFERTTASTRTLLNWLAALEEHSRYSLRFVIAGTTDFSASLREHSLRNLAQRRPTTWSMNPLDSQEALLYLRTKWLAVNGGDNIDAVFPADVCARLHAASKGWPGSLNELAIREAEHYERRAPTAPRVVLTRDGKTLRIISMPPGNYVVGRSKLSDIQVDDRFVSNNHALLQVYRNAVLLVDLNSTNGTTVNSIQVRTKILRNDDVISLGHHRLKVENTPAYTAEVEQQIDIAETQTLKQLDDIRRARARHTIAALKHK
ncbi:MAG TPA: FHA domain-containing protein [Woeseiaceae bacterium]|nr:FHA domain-containing protein [Woeseiaceae bacterium]